MRGLEGRISDFKVLSRRGGLRADWVSVKILAGGWFGFCPFPGGGILLEMGVRARFEIADSRFQILKGLGGLTAIFVAMSL